MATIHDDVQRLRGGFGTKVRLEAADAAVSVDDTDGVILLRSSDASAKSITMGGAFEGHRLTLALQSYASTGSYTVACTRAGSAVTVTLDAVGEGCELVHDGTNWELVALTGGATAA